MLPLKTSLRLARRSDGPGILACHAAALRGLWLPEHPEEKIQAWIGHQRAEDFQAYHPACYLVVAQTEGRISGFAELNVSQGEIRSLFVHPDFARQRIGTMLVLALEHRAAEEGTQRMHVIAAPTAVPFYERFGYATLEPTAVMMNDGTELPALWMRKSFSQNKINPAALMGRRQG